MEQPALLALLLILPLCLLLLLYLPRRQNDSGSVSGPTRSGEITSSPPVPTAQATPDLQAYALELVQDAVLLLDENRVVTFANRSARSLYQVDVGRPLIESLRDYELESLIRLSPEKGRECSSTINLSRARRVVHAVARPLNDSGMALVLSDETQIRHLDQVRRELVANISHELRTPIATLQLLADTLVGGAVDDEEARTYFLEKIREQIAHLSDIVQQSLYLASLESGQRPAQLTAVSVSELITATVERLQPQATQKGINVSVRIEPGLPAANADFDQVERVLTNLLDNAIKWTPPGREISIHSRLDGSYVRFEVRDAGPGIPADRLHRLFERFYTGEESRSHTGTGLGLAIAKHTVEMHGGHIWAESEEGQGASFYFTLPIYAR